MKTYSFGFKASEAGEWVRLEDAKKAVEAAKKDLREWRTLDVDAPIDYMQPFWLRNKKNDLGIAYIRTDIKAPKGVLCLMGGIELLDQDFINYEWMPAL